jgi:hypothetical protein
MLFLLTAIICAQEENAQSANDDSTKINNNESIQTNTLIRDWRIFNYPFTAYPNLGYQSNSLYSIPFSGINSPFQNYTASKEEMLAQFRSLQNWDAKKKYSVFAEYLGYAQFLGAMGVLGVHLSQWSKLKNTPSKKLQPKTYGRYDFK